MEVLFAVFKVAVLHEFGIETAVSSIADVLEENADELVADGFLLVLVHVEGCCYHRLVAYALCRELRKQFFAVFAQCLLVEISIKTQFGVPVHESVRLLVGDGDELSLLLLPVDECAVLAYFEHDFSLAVGAEMAEVACRCRHAHAFVGRGEVDVEALLRLPDDRTEASAPRHARIVLRPPCDKVFTIDGGEARSDVVHLEHGAPRAVFSPQDIGIVHAFLFAPRPVVGVEQLAHLVPGTVVVVDSRHMESLTGIGTVEKQLALCIGYDCHCAE